jgi:hypothetical protein
MTNLRRRLNKLEAQFTDRTGLIPVSTEWMEYWSDRFVRIIDGEDAGEPSRVPIAFADAILAETDRT